MGATRRGSHGSAVCKQRTGSCGAWTGDGLWGGQGHGSSIEVELTGVLSQWDLLASGEQPGHRSGGRGGSGGEQLLAGQAVGGTKGFADPDTGL